MVWIDVVGQAELDTEGRSMRTKKTVLFCFVFCILELTQNKNTNPLHEYCPQSLPGLDSIYGNQYTIDNDQNKRLKREIQLSPVVGNIILVFSTHLDHIDSKEKTPPKKNQPL